MVGRGSVDSVVDWSRGRPRPGRQQHIQPSLERGKREQRGQLGHGRQGQRGQRGGLEHGQRGQQLGQRGRRGGRGGQRGGGEEQRGQRGGLGRGRRGLHGRQQHQLREVCWGHQQQQQRGSRKPCSGWWICVLPGKAC